MKTIFFIFTLLLAITAFGAGTKKASDIAWNSDECSNPLLLPEHFYVSKYGKGKYRVDGMMSQGHFNCIYISFQASDSLDSASVADARNSTFTLKGKEVTWRTYKTVVEGRSVIRKEALIPNILPRQKQGNDSDYIWLRIDVTSPEILDQLTPIAEATLNDAA